MILEVLDRRGGVRERRVLSAFPATLGRAYDCEVILDDAYVSPHHARIVRGADGALWVEDRQSLNGTTVDGVVVGGSGWRIVDDGIVCLGETRLRFRSPSHAVVEARRLPQAEAEIPAPRLRLLTASLVAVTLLHALREAVADTPDPLEVSQLATQVFMVASTLVTWAGSWALVTRLVQARFAFTAHLAIAAASLLAFDFVGTLVQRVAFAWSAALLPELLSWFLMYVVSSFTLYAHLRQSWRASRQRVAAGAASAVALVLIAVAVPYWTADDVRERWQSEHMSQLGPAWARLREPITSEAFVARFDEMERRLAADDDASPAP